MKWPHYALLWIVAQILIYEAMSSATYPDAVSTLVQVVFDPVYWLSTFHYMDLNRQVLHFKMLSTPKISILLLLLFSLLCMSSSSKSVTGARRQKRSLMKMMMHIMWDPVRLIRYWYAYDVTHEIIKSWRKILPTLMVMPINPHAASTPGIAKYVHPPYGKKYKSHKQFQYPSLSSGEVFSSNEVKTDYAHGYFQQKQNSFLSSPSNLDVEFPHKHLASESASNVDSIPMHYHPYIESEEIADTKPKTFSAPASLGNLNDAYHFILQPVHYSSEKNSQKTYHGLKASSAHNTHQSMGSTFPSQKAKVSFKKSSGSLKAPKVNIPISTFSFSDLGFNETNPQYLKQPQSGRKSHLRIKSDASSSNNKLVPKFPNSKVLQHGNQEIHVVFHPITLNDSRLHPESHAFQFVPVQPGKNTSADFNHLQIPFVLPTLTNFRKATAPPKSHNIMMNPIWIGGNDQSVSEDSDEESTESPEMQDMKVNWVIQHQSAIDRRKDGRFSTANKTKKGDNNLQSKFKHLTAARNLSSSKDFQPQINGQHIDLIQLKENLKLGTPVFIPFNKIPKRTQPPLNQALKEQTKTQPVETSLHDFNVTEKDVLNVPTIRVPITSVPKYNFKAALYDTDNSSKKVLVLFKNKQ